MINDSQKNKNGAYVDHWMEEISAFSVSDHKSILARHDEEIKRTYCYSGKRNRNAWNL